MKVLYGTGNKGKFSSMQRVFTSFDHELICLNDLDIKITDVIEEGETPLENACKKAEVYYDAFKLPVFSCDSGMVTEGIPDALQPGVHVRVVNGKRLSDEESVEHGFRDFFLSCL